jgi:hypothetical protein
MNLKHLILPASLIVALALPATALAQSGQQEAAMRGQSLSFSRDNVTVTITSSPGNSIVGDSKIDFDAMDTNHNGWLSLGEASSNATLAAEFEAVDNDHDRKLTREELKGWM